MNDQMNQDDRQVSRLREMVTCGITTVLVAGFADGLRLDKLLAHIDAQRAEVVALQDVPAIYGQQQVLEALQHIPSRYANIVSRAFGSGATLLAQAHHESSTLRAENERLWHAVRSFVSARDACATYEGDKDAYTDEERTQLFAQMSYCEDELIRLCTLDGANG